MQDTLEAGRGYTSISPDWKPHGDLEKRVGEELERLGYYNVALTYHSALPKEVADLLSRRYSPTALYIRGRADRLAIHKTIPVEFEWEVKTALNPRYQNMAVEALPLIHHINKMRLGVSCLYAYHNPYTNHHAGFWVEELPEICAVNIPSRWSRDTVQWFTDVFKRQWPTAPINLTTYKAGSGDPYVLIHSEVVERLSHWQTLIDLVGRVA